MNRRIFFSRTSAALASIACGPSFAADKHGVAWPIGCFNRAWSRWGLEEGLDGIKAAGFTTAGLLTRTKTDPLIGVEATAEYLDALKEKIAARGLRVILGTVRSPLNGGLENAINGLQQQIDNAKRLDLKYVMTFGVDRPEDYDSYYKLMAKGAAYAHERGVRVVMKPHGGASGASEEILRCIKQINHPNFSIWYDAGNIIHYTGKDPVTELEPIARHVTGFCAKDCAREKGEVMIQLGSGKVPFQKVFSRLKAAGFEGPIMLEGSDPGQSAAEATANARRNREYLEVVLASI
jgi:sugar phosphate isomerase/epimerase